MAARHRKRGSRSKKFAMVGVATATATAMTVGAAPPPPKPKPVVYGDFDLAAAIRPFPPPDQIPDLTGGLGTVGYDLAQALADAFIRGVVGNVNFANLARAAGLDPDSLIEGLLGSTLNELPADLLGRILDEIPLDPGQLVGAILDGLNLPLPPLIELALGNILAGALGSLGIDTVGALLRALGIDLSDPLNLANLNVPGVNLITTGPPFTLLKLLGADLGWVPGLPNSVANEINNTGYVTEDLTDLLGDLGVLGPVTDLLGTIGITLPQINAIDVRVPVVVGFGLGAFAAGAAYEKVLADLANQPGGTNYQGLSLLGSITVLPMVLLRNPGRANGGLFARFYPLFGLFGIDTVTPETQVTHSGGIPILNTGLSLGGANLIPVKVDGTVMYDLMSDFPSWPNPFSMANSLVGAMLPTYLFRGITVETVPDQLESQLDDILDNPLGEPLAINLYLTIPTATQPLLEPLYLLSDITSIATFGMASTNPFGLLANALAPAVESLNNLGYTDVVRNADGTYTRTLTDAGTPTSFFSFPAVNPVQVIPDVINLLVKGFTKEFFSGNPTPATPNAITSLINLLTGGGLGPLGNLGSIVQGVLDGLNPAALAQQVMPQAANAVPSANTRLVPLSNETGLEDAKAELDSATEDSELTEAEGEEEDVVDPMKEILKPVEQALKPVHEVLKPVQEILTPVEETDEEAIDEEATDEEAEEESAEEDKGETTESSGRHHKPEGEDEPAPSSVTSHVPRHAKDIADKVTSGLRDIANAVTPKTNEKTTEKPTEKESPKDAADDTKSDDEGAQDNAA